MAATAAPSRAVPPLDPLVPPSGAHITAGSAAVLAFFAVAVVVAAAFAPIALVLLPAALLVPALVVWRAHACWLAPRGEGVDTLIKVRHRAACRVERGRRRWR